MSGMVLKEKKSKGGRPSKFGKTDMKLVEKLYKAGLDDSQVAGIIDVTEQTINNWKNAHPKFFESLKDWKLEADAKVEVSLYKSALGFTTKHKKAVVVSDGKDCGSHIEMVEEENQHPPNSTSIIYWLKNRKPREWADKKDLNITVNIADEIREARERVARGILERNAN